MILYKGRSGKVVQYMPKPIKHGIKVYCLYSDTGNLYAFKVVTVKEVEGDSCATTMWTIMEDLIILGGLTEKKDGTVSWTTSTPHPKK